MKSDITLLNFDGSYEKQSFYSGKTYEWIDFQSLSNASLFCEKKNLAFISKELTLRKQSGIYFLGSGNYHYVSHVLQSKINNPFSLVLFDHHTDTLPSPSETLISCGSWVLESLLDLPMLKKVFIIGVSEEAQKHIPKSVNHQVITYTENAIQANLPTIIKSLLKKIPTDSVYISIDKDVLDKRAALTGWDHGTLGLKQMLDIVETLFLKKAIVGVDVCGEYPVNPANEYEKKTRDAIEKNNRTNGIILEKIIYWANMNYNSSALLAKRPI